MQAVTFRMQGKGEMRTYWLTGEERRRGRYYVTAPSEPSPSTAAAAMPSSTTGVQLAIGGCNIGCHSAAVAQIKTNERHRPRLLPSISSVSPISQCYPRGEGDSTVTREVRFMRFTEIKIRTYWPCLRPSTFVVLSLYLYSMQMACMTDSRLCME